MAVERAGWLAVAGGLAAVALVASAWPVALAAPLDQQTCDQLKREIGDLERIGARDNMAKGPAWAKANLTSGKLEEIKKLIEIEEAIAFRCPRPKPVQQAADPGAPPAKVKPKQPVARAKPKPGAEGAPSTSPGATAAAAAPAAKPKPKPKPPAAPADAGSAAAPAPAPTPPKPAPRPARKPVEKTDDAAAPKTF